MIDKTCILKALGELSTVPLNCGFNENVSLCIQKLEEDENICHLTSLQNLQRIYKQTSINTCSGTWKFVCVSLECLVCLKEIVKEEAEKLLSVAQQRSVRHLLEKVVSVGLVPYLLPGVEPIKKTANSSLPDFEKYECLCLVTLALINLYEDDTFHGIVLPQFLSPVLCALCQLTMAPLKQSTDTFLQLQRERMMFQQHFDKLLNKLYQPMIVKELMVIEGNKKCPKWLKRGVGRLLTTQLHRPRGVWAVIEAVRDAANCAAPTSQAHMESVARVITASSDLDSICPQVLVLLDSSDAELVRIAVLCTKTLQDKDPSACDLHFLRPITKPLTCSSTSEQQLTLCLQRLSKLFAVPASDFWCLPAHLLRPYIYILFQLLCKVYQSASHIRKTIEDLVWCFLYKSEESSRSEIFHCLIYKDSFSGILMMDGVEFVFGDEGGLKLSTVREPEHSLEEFGDCLMVLLEKNDTNGMLSVKLYETLLKVLVSVEESVTNPLDSFEKQLVTLKLLTVLSENLVVQRSLTKNPEPFVKFLSAMINNGTILQHSLHSLIKEEEVIRIVLLVLSFILNDCLHLKTTNWQVFSDLEEPLNCLKSKTNNMELRLLAEEAYEVIKTRGALKFKQSEKHKTSSSISKPSPSECEKVLKDACDALLPVRGHAMIQLGKLLASGDKQAKAKKEQILCIFQENLKQEDSYLYLSAIESLSVAAAEFPDVVVVSLAEQFSQKGLPPEIRMKVGEALMRTTKQLGDLVPVYKAELINAFLNGTKDDDFLVRASSLSNLGELCRVLGFRVGSIIAEVLLCAKCIVSSDPSVEVRRAAVLLIGLLLKGLHKDALTVLQDVLLDLYHSLKHVYSTDKDDVTRLQAQLALEELNSGTIAFLFPKPQLTKRIFVLDPPS